MLYRHRYWYLSRGIGRYRYIPEKLKCCGGMCATSFLLCVLGAMVDNVLFGSISHCRSTGIGNGRGVITGTGSYSNLDKNTGKYQNTSYCLWNVPVPVYR